MALKARTLVGLDVHAAQTHAAIVDPTTGEVRVIKLRMAPDEVVGFLDGLGPGVLAVYEAGPTGFVLARAGAGCRCARGGTGVDPEGLWRSGQDRPAGRDPSGAVARRR